MRIAVCREAARSALLPEIWGRGWMERIHAMGAAMLST